MVSPKLIVFLREENKTISKLHLEQKCLFQEEIDARTLLGTKLVNVRKNI